MKAKSFVGKFLTLAVATVALATLAYATQGIVKSSTYYTSASTVSNNVSRVAPTGNVAIDIVTASVSGVPAVTPTVQGIDNAGNAFDICVGQAISAAGTQTIQVGPALTATSGTVGSGTVVSCSAVVPDLFRVKMANTSGVGTNGATSTIYYNTSP